MQHIDEHILELLALGDANVLKKEAQIKKHLKECAGCKLLFLEITGYYDDVWKVNESEAPPLGSLTTRSLVRKRNDLEPYFAKPHLQGISFTEVNVPSVWRRMNRFRLGHPVASSLYVIAFAAMVYLSISYSFSSHNDPAYYYYNVPNHTIEVYSSNGKLLWAKDALSLASVSSLDRTAVVNHTVVADLYGNGRNEVVTTVRMPDDPNRDILRVFSGSGRLIQKFVFPPLTVNFRGASYDTPFGAQDLLAVPMPDGTVNIFVSSSNGRSPSILARLNGKMQIIGEYFHYGNFVPYLLPAKPGKVAPLALVGSDDIGDMSGDSHEFLAIINPDKLVGIGESSATKGFGYPISSAEEYYVRFPITDGERALGIRFVSVIEGDPNDSDFYVGLKSSYTMAGPNSFGFDFVFDQRDMGVREVKVINNSQITYAELKREGKVHGTFDQQYLANLKDGVRYWNGSHWVKEPTRIIHGDKARQSVALNGGG